MNAVLYGSCHLCLLLWSPVISFTQLNLDMASKSIYSMLNSTLLGYFLQLNAYHSGVLSTPLKPSDLVLGPEDMGNLSLVLPAVRPMYYVGTDEEVGTPAFRDAVSKFCQVIQCGDVYFY